MKRAGFASSRAVLPSRAPEPLLSGTRRAVGSRLDPREFFDIVPRMPYVASSDEILRSIQEAMKTLFDLDPARVHPEARLVEDLDLDSIDAIDLAAKIEEATGRRFDEASLRQLRTIQDVVTAIQAAVAAASPEDRIPA